jgi:hypothetical protein
MAIGGLIGYTGRHFTHACASSNGRYEVCSDDVSGDDLHMFSVTGAFLF